VVLGQTPDGATVRGVGFIRESLNSTSLSSGLKINPGGHLLLALNLLARVNNGGLRAAVIPLIGLSYVFEAPSTPAITPRPTKNAGIPAQASQVPATLAKAPMPVPAAVTEPPTRDISPDAVKNRQKSYQPDLDRMVQVLNSQAHFVSDAPPAFMPFHNGLYLQLSLTTTLPNAADGSQYRLAALAFDRHVAHLIRPVLEYFRARDDFDGIDFSTSVRLAGNASPDATPVAVEFIFPLGLLRSYAQFDCTGQQLIDASFVRINGERVSLNLQIAEAGFQSQ
jgi:hypothetical protein